MIQALIKQSKLLIVVDTPLTENSVEQHILNAKFSEDWTNLAKTAVFVNGSTTATVAIDNDKCEIPWEVLENSGKLQIGITGTDSDTVRFTTTISTIDIEKSLVSNELNPDSTLEWWEQYILEVQLAISSAVEQANIAKSYAENAKISEENSQKLLDNISDEVKDFNTNVEEKTTEFNKVVETATSEYKTAVEDFEKLADGKESSLSDLSDTLIKNFNDNATEKTESFDDNASAKTTAYTDLSTTKTTAFEKLVSDSETEITDLATAKTNTFDSNAEEKTSDFNAVVTSANETIDGKVETVESLAEDIDNAIVDYVGDRTALYDETEQNEPTVVDFVKSNKSELEKARESFLGDLYEDLYARLMADFSAVYDRFNQASLVPYSDTFINASNTYVGLTSGTEIKGVTVQDQYYIQTVEDSVVQFDDGVGEYAVVTSDVDCEVTRCGKNLLNINEALYTSNISNFVISDNQINFDYDGTWPRIYIDIPVFVGKYITANATIVNTNTEAINSIQLYITYSDGTNQTYSLNSSTNPFPVEMTADMTNIRAQIIVNNRGTSMAGSVTITNWQVEIGGSNTDCEPHTGSTTTLTANTPTQIPLLDGTNTFFADSVDNLTVRYLTETETEETTPTVDFPQEMSSVEGDLTITSSNSEETKQDTTTYSDITLRSLPNGVCDVVKPITGTITKNIGIRDYADGDYELSNVYTDGTNTLYQLDTPITEELSEDKKELRTYDGTTNIFTTGTDVMPIISTNIPSNIGAVVADQSNTIASQANTITEQASTIESLTNELSSVQEQSNDTDEVLNELIGGESV